MSIVSRLLILSFFILIPKSWGNVTETQIIHIDLPDHFMLNELNFFQIYEMESLAQHKIIIQDKDKQDIFGLLQVHSFKFSVGLENTRGNITNGTNIGFFVHNDREFVLTNTNNFIKVQVAIAFVSMSPTHKKNNCPYPNPIIKISDFGDEETDILRVGSEMTNCSSRDDDVTYESRYKYLRVGDMTPNTYFEGIKDMITVNGAKNNGRETHLTFNEGNELVGLFAKIKGTGIVFQTIVLDNSGRFVYIPAVTYSCNVFAWKNECSSSDPLNVGFYVIFIIISVLMMTRMLLPRSINDLSVGLGTGLVLGVFLSLLINMEMNWRAFLTIFTSLTSAGLNYLLNQRYSKISHYLTSFWLCFVSTLTLFYVANFSFNLVDYQYIFVIAFILIISIVLAKASHIEYQVSIILGSYLFMFAITFFTNGHLNNIIEQPYYLAKDFNYLQAVKRLLIAPQDAIAFCFALILAICLVISYNCYGNMWERSRERQRLLMARRVALGGGTLEERIQIASEQTPLITRYTESEEDEVFESPNTNRALYSRIKGHK